MGVTRVVLHDTYELALTRVLLMLLLLCRLWTWRVWGPSARQCCARPPAPCQQPSATSTRWRSPSCRGTRPRWMQTKTRKRRKAIPGRRRRSTRRPPAWAFPGTPRVTTALRSPPTWLTSESASPAPSAPSANTSFSICSRTPATGGNLYHTTWHLSG